jgi:hypothetical protein
MTKEDLIREIANLLKKRDSDLLTQVKKQLRTQSVNVVRSSSGR